jgi:high-affinity iron transporter
VAAGVLSYGFHDLQEAGIITFGTGTAWDLTSWYSASSWYGSILKGVFNFSPNPTVLDVVVWWAYFVPTTFFFCRGLFFSVPDADRPVAPARPGADQGRTVESLA